MSSTLCSPAVEHRVADGGGPRGGSVSPRERGWRAPRHAYAVFVYGVPPSNFPAPAEICAFDGETSIAGWRTRPQLTAATCTKLCAQRNCAPMGAHSQGIAGATKPLWSWMAARCRRVGRSCPRALYRKGAMEPPSCPWRHGNARSVPAMHEAARVLGSLFQGIRLVDRLDPFRLGIAVPDDATPRLDVELPVFQDRGA